MPDSLPKPLKNLLYREMINYFRLIEDPERYRWNVLMKNGEKLE